MIDDALPHPRPWYKRKRYYVLTAVAVAVTAVCAPPLLQPMGKPGRFDDELDRAAAIAMPREGKDGWPQLKAACDAFERTLSAETAQREKELGRALLQEESADASSLLDDPAPPDGLSPAQVERALVTRRVMEALDAEEFWLKLDALAECGHTIQPRERGIPFLDHTFYEVGWIRAIERFNGARLQLAARSGNGEEVVRSLRRSLDIARLTPPEYGEIASVLRLAVRMHVQTALRDEVASGRLDAPTLQACADVLQQVERVRAERLFATEHVRGLDLMELLHTDNGRGDGYLNVEAIKQLPTVNAPSRSAAIAGVLFDSKAQARTKYTALFDRCIEDLDSDKSVPAVCEDLQAQRKAIQSRRAMCVFIVMPDLEKCVKTARRSEMELDATRLTIALQRYHAQHASYPATLDQLAPTYVTEVPLDRFTIRPFGYRVNNAEDTHTCTLYSIGYDLTDNAAAEQTNKINDALSSDAPNTDFILARLRPPPPPPQSAPD